MNTHAEPNTVAAIDLSRYLGTWFEIARLPMRHEPEDASNITAHYSLNQDGSVRVQNRCLDHGQVREAIGRATATDASNSRLEVSFLPEALRWIPFSKGDYWILRIDADYRVALVGSPDRRYLWLLARQPQLDAVVRQHYLDYAVLQGYTLDRLIDTPHSGHPTA